LIQKSLIIVGGGYSVAKGIKQGLWERIKGNDIWSLNFAYKTMPYLPSTEIWIDKMFLSLNLDVE
jgi:hypothetical protein